MRLLLPGALLLLSTSMLTSCSESTSPSQPNNDMVIAYSQVDLGGTGPRIAHAIIADSNGVTIKDLGIGNILSIGQDKVIVGLLDTATNEWTMYLADKAGNKLSDVAHPEDQYGISGSAAAQLIGWGYRLSDGEGLLVQNYDGSDSHVITEHRAHETTFSFSPTGDRIAFIQVVGEKYQVCVANVDGTNLKVIEEISPTAPDGYDGVTWSPVSDELVYRNNHIIHHHDLTTGVTTPLELGELPGFTADGTGVTYTGAPGDIYLTKDLGATKVNLTNTPDRAEAYPSWSPDGKKMLFLHWSGDFDHTTGSLGILDLTTNQMRTVATPAYAGYFVK